MKVIFIIPTYDEEKIIEKTIRKLPDYLKQNLKNYQHSILIADNGSNDNTVKIADQLSSEYPEIKYFHIPQKGRGYALKKAWSEYEADIYFYMDCDLATSLEAIRPTVEAIVREGFDIAIGSRLAKGARVTRSWLREITSRGLNVITKPLLSTKISDMQCGFKAVNKKIVVNVLPKIKDNGWFFDTELIILAEKSGYKIKEIPVEWVESRSQKRKSKVKIISTIVDDLKKILALRKRISKIYGQKA